MGYAIGLIIGIPLFILIINFLFLRGNNPSETQVEYYINNSVIDTIVLPETPKYNKEQYTSKLRRRGGSSVFIYRYPFYSSKYKKHFVLMLFIGFDRNGRERWSLLYDKENEIKIRINKEQLNKPEYGTEENPIPVFPMDLLNFDWERKGYPDDWFHISDELNAIFVEEYLKFFMPKEDFKEMFSDVK